MKCDKCGFEHNNRNACPKCGARVIFAYFGNTTLKAEKVREK